MNRFLTVTPLVLIGLLLQVSVASADPKEDPCYQNPDASICATGNGNGFGAGGSNGSPGTPGQPGQGGGKPVSLPSTYRIYAYAPTCTGNTRLDADVLCGAAVNTCLPWVQSRLSSISQVWLRLRYA